MNDLLALLVIVAALLGALWIAGHPEAFPDERPRRRRDDF